MANHNNGPRYSHPLGNDRYGQRFNKPHNRNFQGNHLNDGRPRLSNPNNSQTRPPAPFTNSTAPKPNSSTTSNASTSSEQQTTTAVASSNETRPIVNSESSNEVNSPSSQRAIGTGGQKRPHPGESSRSSQGGRSRLFIGNISFESTQEEVRELFNKYGELVESFINPSRGFGFIKLTSRQMAERAKQELDGFMLRGKPLRIRFANQGAIVKVKNLSPNVSNELLKEAFEQYFGDVERAVVIVDDRGKSIGEGIVEFEKKPSAQKCLNECTERCFFITSELKPIVVEPWDTNDDEDGLPEKSLIRNNIYAEERKMKPRFGECGTIEQTIGLKWKELELHEKKLLDEVKRQIQFASEKLQIEIEQMLLEHRTQLQREELTRRQEYLRRYDESRSWDFDRQRPMMSLHHSDPNAASSTSYLHNDFSSYSYNNQFVSNPSFNHPAPIDAAYTTNQVARSFMYNQPNQEFDRKRARF